MARSWRNAVVAAAALARLPCTEAFIDELFGQAFGGGGGGNFQFQMGDGGMFQMGGGGGRAPKKPKWPKNVPDKVMKNMAWMKGTEWNWNDWRNVKFEKDGTFSAPTRDCQNEQCLWSAKSGKVYILWGEAGLHELDVVGEVPTEQNQKKMQGMKIKGKRVSDGEKCFAKFQRVHDFEAAELDKDLYEILGLPDDASEVDIKKVYRKLSIKYHPDKNPDEDSKQKFADVRDAYEILNDPDKKILYDTGGMEAVKKLDKGEVEKGEDFSGETKVSLEQLYNSDTDKVQINRRVVCRGCSKQPQAEKCRRCNRCPNELKTVHVQVGPGMYMQQQQEVQSMEKCKHEDTVLEVQIEKGMRDGEQVTFQRMGEQRPGVLPGSVVLTLKQQKHKMFERRGNDLHVQLQISLQESLLGWSRTLTHLDGHKVEVGTTSVTQPFQVLRVQNEGMPHRDDPASFGDLLVKAEIVFPKSLTKDQQQKLANVFPPDAPRAAL